MEDTIRRTIKCITALRQKGQEEYARRMLLGLNCLLRKDFDGAEKWMRLCYVSP